MSIIPIQEQRAIRQWSADLVSPVKIALAREEHPVSDRLDQFCEELKAAVAGMQLRKDPDEPFAKPALILGRHDNIAYQALPLGKELPPFLEALGRSVQGPDTTENDPSPDLRIELPAALLLFIAPQCPHCPQAAARLLSLADANPPIRLSIIDGTLFEDLARMHDIRSVPTLILDNQLRWTGQIDTDEVIRQCAQRDPSQLSAASLRQIIESGEAARAAAMMTEHQVIFPALIDLLIHPRWSVRLGAMVAAEYLADESPGLAAKLVDPLWQHFPGLDEPIQVDVVQMLAQIGNAEAKGHLKSIAAGDFAPLVREAAVEELNSGAL